MKQESWQLDIGAVPLGNDSVHFRVWAPGAERMDVIIKEHGSYPMQKDSTGYFSTEVSGITPGRDYVYRIDNEKERPDPASRWQPEGVHAPSRIYDPDTFSWSDQDWSGIQLEEYILYELHVGTYTPEGTFDALIGKIPYLKELGVTAVELMPVAQFPGSRNWGYDGVYPFAPQQSYGGPDGLKRFVNACHEEGLAVVLDVVYNHLGPEGNYLADFGPYFTNKYKTPWGRALNFDDRESEPVRRYFLANALYWLTEYHIDALRLDAVHAIYDFGAEHFLLELSRAFHSQADALGRKAWLIAESDLNDVRIINPATLGGYAVDAQWSDDFHHAVHAYVENKSNGYFADFGSLSDIAKALEEGFVNDGRWSPFRRRRHGSSSTERPGEQFVICTQNHDQVANAYRGSRLGSVLTLEQQKLTAALLILAPNLPMLFMGQEWDESHPFLYFTSHSDKDLIEAVRNGYAEECARYYGFTGEVHDPQDEQTFQKCKLDWKKTQQAGHSEILLLYRDLIQVRKEHHCLSNCRKDLCEVRFDEQERWLHMMRKGKAGTEAALFCNFSDRSFRFSPEKGKCVLDTSSPHYGGPGARESSKRPPWSAALFIG